MSADSITCNKVDLSNDSEASVVLQLLNIYSNDPMGDGKSLDQYVQDNLIKELRNRQYCHVFLCRVNNDPAALAITFEGFSTFKCKPLINFHDVVVIPQYRGRGLSQVLIKAIEDFAVSISCCKLTLEVLEGNRVAKNAYIKAGFEGYQLDPELGNAVFWQKKL